MAARIDFTLDFEINLDVFGLTFSESFLSSLSELGSVGLLVLSITFWWNHVWNISWMWLDVCQVFFVTIWGILLVSGEVNLIVLIEVPRVVSNDVWDNLRVSFNSVVLHSLGISDGLWVLIDLSESWLNLVTRWVLGLVIPGLFVGLIILVVGPGLFLSVFVREDFGVRIFAWVGSDDGVFLNERWFIMSIFGWLFGLSVPLLLAGHVELIFVPRVVSLDVWGDFRVRILTWVGTLLGERWFVMSVFGWLFGLSVPLLLAGHVELIFVPRVVSLDVWGDFRVRILTWVGTLLGERWFVMSVFGWLLGFGVPLLLAGHIELILVPGMISLDVWGDLGVGILAWVGSLLGERWFIMSIFGWLLGFGVPLLLAGHIELILVPRVVSLNVWSHFGMRILAWVGALLDETWLNLVS